MSHRRLWAGALVGLAGLGLVAVRPAPRWPGGDQQALLPPGVVRAGEYRVLPSGPPPPPPTRALESGSVYDVGPFPLVTPELAPGEGRDVTLAMCSVCHSVRYITMQPPLPPEVWQAAVRKMIDVHGAAIPEDAAGRITTYLQTHYVPVSR